MRDIATTPVGVYQSYFSGRVRTDENADLAARALEGDVVVIGGVEVNVNDEVTLEEARAITGRDDLEFDRRAAEGACLTEECSDEAGSAERTTISVDEARDMLGYMQRYAEAHNLSETTVRALYQNGASFERVNLREVRDNRAVRGDELVQRYAEWHTSNPNGTVLQWASTAQNAHGLGIPATESPLYSNLQAYIEAAPEEEPRTIEEVANFLLLSAYSSRHPEAGQILVMSDLVGDSFQPVTNVYGRNYENEPDLLTWLSGADVQAPEPEVAAEEPAPEVEEDPPVNNEAEERLAARQTTWARFFRMCGWDPTSRRDTVAQALLTVSGVGDNIFEDGLNREQWEALQESRALDGYQAALPDFEDMIEGEETDESRVAVDDVARDMQARVDEVLADEADPSLHEIGIAIRAAVPGSDEHGRLFALSCAARVAQAPGEYEQSAPNFLSLMREHPGVRFTVGDRIAFYVPAAEGEAEQICVLALSAGSEAPLSIPLPQDVEAEVILRSVLQFYGRDQRRLNPGRYLAPHRALTFLGAEGREIAPGSTINVDVLVEAARGPRANAQALAAAFDQAVTAPVAQATTANEEEAVEAVADDVPLPAAPSLSEERAALLSSAEALLSSLPDDSPAPRRVGLQTAIRAFREASTPSEQDEAAEALASARGRAQAHIYFSAGLAACSATPPDYATALESVRAAYQSWPHPVALVREIWILQQQGNTEEANIRLTELQTMYSRPDEQAQFGRLYADVVRASGQATRPIVSASGALLAFLQKRGNEEVRVRVGQYQLWSEDGNLHILRADNAQDRIIDGSSEELSLAIRDVIAETREAQNNASDLSTIADFLWHQTGLSGRTIDVLELLRRAQAQNIEIAPNSRGLRRILDEMIASSAQPPAPEPVASAANYREVRLTV